MTTKRKSSSDLSSMKRATLRKQRLVDIEKEQRREEEEALTMTEEQRQTLFLSFKSVKVEFSDLDGLTWTQSALRNRCHRVQSSNTCLPPLEHPPSTFAILTNADLASFDPDDTIRASVAHPRPRFSSALKSQAPSNSCTLLPTSSSKYNHRDGARNRSPVKGLFIDLTPSDEDDSDLQNGECDDEPEVFTQTGGQGSISGTRTRRSCGSMCSCAKCQPPQSKAATAIDSSFTPAFITYPPSPFPNASSANDRSPYLLEDSPFTHDGDHSKELITSTQPPFSLMEFDEDADTTIVPTQHDDDDDEIDYSGANYMLLGSLSTV